MISEADIAVGGRLADKIDEATRFIATETNGDSFANRQDRENAARRLLTSISAEDYVEHVADTQLENREKRVSIQRWAIDLVADLRLQDGQVFVSDVLNGEDPDLLQRFSDFCDAASKKRPREPETHETHETHETSDMTPLVVLTGASYSADHWSRNPKLLDVTPGMPHIVSLEKLRECADLRTVVDRASSTTKEDGNVWTIAIDLRKSAGYDDTFRDPGADFLTSSLHRKTSGLEPGFRARIRDFIDEVYEGWILDGDAGDFFETKPEQSGKIVGKIVFKT